MKAQYPAMMHPKGTYIDGNDNMHDKMQPGGHGGGPLQNKKHIPHAQKGGVGQSGQKPYARASIAGTRGASGNPASRGGTPVSFHPDRKISGHGGSPQRPTGARPHGGGFGHSGQKNVPSYPHAHPKPKGQPAGTAFKQISGHFNRKAMGAKATGDSGNFYGSPPVTANT